MPRRYKERQFQQAYDTMMRVAADPASEMYFQGKQRGGASHRCCFWAGYNGGTRPRWVGEVGTLGNVYYMAGKDFAKIKPGIPVGAPAHPFAKT